MIRLGFAEESDEYGLVAELDPRFRMRMTSENFKTWRFRKAVRAARVKMREPEPPEERKYRSS